LSSVAPTSPSLEDTSSPRALDERDRRFWRRHPGDVARLVARSILLVLMLIITAAAPGTLRDVSQNVVNLFGELPDAVRYALIGLAQLTIVAIPLAVIAWLILRRSWLETALVIGAAAVGAIVMGLLTDWLARAAPPVPVSGLDSASFLPTDFPSSAYLAALVAGTAAAAPLMPDAWRRTSWLAVVIAVGVRFMSATETPVNVVVTVLLGSVIGSVALVAFGSPRRRPGAVSLRADLAAGGFLVDDLRDEVEHDGRRSYRGSSDGNEIAVVYLDRDDRDVDLLARAVRTIRVRDVDEQSLSVRPMQRVQHEAVVTMMALQTGARVPVVHAVVPAVRDSAIIALDVPPGRSLAELQGDEVSEAALDDLWHQLDHLHRGRIAHRSLTLQNLVLDGDWAWLAGLENGRLVAGDESRALDVAELLVSTSLVVGVERAITAAVRSADHDELVASLSFIQPPALPPQTRRAAKKPKGLITEIRAGLQSALGVEAVELAELERISIPKLLTWVGFIVLAYFLLSLASSWSEISAAMAGLNWWWVVPILVVTLLGPVAGAVSMMGSVLRPLPLGDTTIVMYGQSFLNRFTPMNAGGMAMRIRYLQKGGTDVTVSTAAIGLTSAASGVMQVLFMAFFLLWSSTDPTDDKQGSGGSDSTHGVAGTVIVVVLIALVLAVLVFAFTPKLRRWLVNFVRSTISKIRHDFGELARQPSKLFMLFGGAGAGKLLTIIAFVLSCRAFGIDLSFAELGALYLIATTIASTVPTPGGVGAIDAALVLVLTNAGVDQGTAWAAALLFRTINYWLPTIPGFLGLKLSERRELI
jgi:uncharacterized membrane protein YbhN (UPF0104 family)/tRNA A-37 threonylcarbamoyl transferase component Bud32